MAEIVSVPSVRVGAQSATGFSSRQFYRPSYSEFPLADFPTDREVRRIESFWYPA